MIIKSIIKRSLTLLAGLSLLGFGGCRTSDDPCLPEESDSGKMVLCLNVAFDGGKVTTRADDGLVFETTSDDFEKIRTLRVIIVRKLNEELTSGIVEANRLVMLNNDGQPINDNLEFKVYANEDKRIYLIANEASLTAPSGSIYKTPGAFLSSFKSREESDLTKLTNWTVSVNGLTETALTITGYENGLFPPSSSSNLPFTEFFDVYVYKDNSNPEEKADLTMFMTPAAAKASFYLNPKEMPEAYKDVTITSISLSGIGSEEYVFPNNTVYSISKYIKGPNDKDIPNTVTTDMYVKKFDQPSNSQPLTYVIDNLNFDLGKNATELITTPHFCPLITPPLYFPGSILEEGENYWIRVTLSTGVTLEAPLVDDILKIKKEEKEYEAIARSTHLQIILQITEGVQGLSATTSLVHYIGCKLDPEFGW